MPCPQANQSASTSVVDWTAPNAFAALLAKMSGAVKRCYTAQVCR
jgi:hypothetical protein